MQIVFVGPPGAGKGTQSARLAEHLAIPHLSTGDMFREACQRQTAVGRSAAEYMNAGKLVPDEVVTAIALDRLQQADCFIVRPPHAPAAKAGELVPVVPIDL